MPPPRRGFDVHVQVVTELVAELVAVDEAEVVAVVVADVVAERRLAPEEIGAPERLVLGAGGLAAPDGVNENVVPPKMALVAGTGAGGLAAAGGANENVVPGPGLTRSPSRLGNPSVAVAVAVVFAVEGGVGAGLSPAGEYLAATAAPLIWEDDEAAPDTPDAEAAEGGFRTKFRASVR